MPYPGNQNMYICPDCKMYLSDVQNVFVQIAISFPSISAMIGSHTMPFPITQATRPTPMLQQWFIDCLSNSENQQNQDFGRKNSFRLNLRQENYYPWFSITYAINTTQPARVMAFPWGFSHSAIDQHPLNEQRWGKYYDAMRSKSKTFWGGWAGIPENPRKGQLRECILYS